ncbi:hypothetical protein H9635_17300 [Solibacillus sp. A46]|uniref:Uncharacterized protein n=1 Tax=Solibacillus faecavium TaxID=2762221 RepID=A0ABR8Y2R0_9BACL|nr:hypothetical protein [Solibacillus faecavium]MBD8038504.1 hypothetical protein [Solibacillus faecavium]
METKISLAIVLASIIIGGSLLYSATNISNSINDVRNDITSSNIQLANSISGNGIIENYELVVIDGWLYLYNSVSGQIWKKADNDNPEVTWQVVEHFSQ